MTDTAPDASERQFIAVKFRSDDERSYTYHNDGPPVGAGQQVKIAPRDGQDGWSRATVVEAFVDRPDFETKPILGLAPIAGEDQ